MSDIRCLEHPTLKVPYENLNKRFRSAQKTIDREMSHVNSALEALEKVVKDSGPVSEDQLPQLLVSLAEKVKTFEEKTLESVADEMHAAENLKTRISHLRIGCDPNANAVAVAMWKRTRLDRMLVEQFLRSGFYDAAVKLAETSNIRHLTNINLFLVAKAVEDSLARKETAKCLTWCHDNKSKMRKMKSNLEFNIRFQEFVELVKEDRRIDAVKHARKFLCNVTPEQMACVQQGMALLAFPKDTLIEPYCKLLSEDRWQQLIEEFRNENYRLFQLSTKSVFTVALQAGLSCLKTQKCSNSNSPQTDRNCQCPVCQSMLHELSKHLPYAHCSQSRLICYMSGKPLNEHNHPMMLPNGYVYGEHALLKMSLENDGQIVCPRTKEIFSFSDAEKIFVM